MFLRALMRFLPQSFRTRIFVRALQSGTFQAALKLIRPGFVSGSAAQQVLSATVQYAPESLLRKLLLSGANLTQTKATAHLVIQARTSKVDSTVKMAALADAGADLNGYSGPKRLKLINLAILNRDEVLFRFLMERGVDLQTADRTGLLPLQASMMLEEKTFEAALRAREAKSAPPSTSLLESLLINENSLWSELHVLIQWCLRNSGFTADQVTLPRFGVLKYRFHHQAVSLKLEFELRPGELLTLLLFDGDSNLAFANLLPHSGKIDSTTLRGHVVTVFTEIRKQIEAGKFKAAPAESASPVLSSETARALKKMGLSKHATETEIIASYRSLAKKYHPDVAPGKNTQMIELNQAYETLRKK